MGTHPIFECDFDCLTEVQMTETVAPVSAKKELPVADEAQEELVYEFENYKDQFYENFEKLKNLKIFNDGSLVCMSKEKLVRFPCNISALSIAIPKLNQEFYQAKRTMVASGFMHSSVDLQLPDFRQEGTSSAETALRIIFQFVFKGKFNVSPMSIKNVAVLAAYLKIDAILESLPAAAEQIGVADFDIEEYKKIASSLGAMKIVGLDKFVNVFGGGQKVQKATKKRTAEVGKALKKNEPVTKKSKPLEEPTIDENSFVIKDEVPPEQMIAEKDSEENVEKNEVAQDTCGDTEAAAEQTVSEGATEEMV